MAMGNLRDGGLICLDIDEPEQLVDSADLVNPYG